MSIREIGNLSKQRIWYNIIVFKLRTICKHCTVRIVIPVFKLTIIYKHCIEYDNTHHSIKISNYLYTVYLLLNCLAIKKDLILE